ncbi:ABC transporter permease [Microbacterium tumbae]
MLLFILKRLGIGLALVWVVLTLIFAAIHAIPGDPAEILASGSGTAAADPATVAAIRAGLGLDRPIAEQYLDFLGGAAVGDFGTSFTQQAPVSQLIAFRLPNSLELMLGAALISIPCGILLGSSAARLGGWRDSVLSGFTAFGVAIPGYVLGTFLVVLFATQLRLLPSGGYVGWDDPAGHLSRLILPVVVLSVMLTSTVARITRATILETSRSDWVRTARSWGLSDPTVFRRHVVRNSLGPVTSVIAIELGALIGSSVVIEQVFTWPGVGSMLVKGVNDRDYPVVIGIITVISIVFIVINIVVDILQGVLDPRARS